MDKLLNTQWNGELYEALPYELYLKEECLCFCVEFPLNARSSPSSEPQEYTPELWKYDVGEVFLRGREGRYLEINLAPNQAYWIQGFTAVRVPDPTFTHQSLSPGFNESSLKMSEQVLENYLGPKEEWRYNVTAILNSPEQVFLSHCLLTGQEADFHQPSLWRMKF